MKDYPHPLISAIPIIVLIGLLITVISLFGSDSLTGGSQVALLLGTAVCVTISMTVYLISWHTFEKQIIKTIGSVSITLVILLAVGMVSGSWTTIATIGVALLGISHALGISEAWAAGAIISGAYFGDKM
jgi:NhaC family Na+:H+ antiporter